MPGRNTIKIFVPDSYYHLYNRGWNRTKIFLDPTDYQYFTNLLQRTLGPEAVKDGKGREYTWLRPKLDLNAYCLMPNHFHVLVYQRAENGISKLMSSVLTAYTMYFNKKYERRGPLFENTYRAVRIGSDDQLMHITRYIHLNHNEYETWPHSSYQAYLSLTESGYIVREPILNLFSGRKAYKQFVDDYSDTHRMNDQAKLELANN